MKTSERLAEELMKVSEKAGAYNAALYKAFACRARTGEFNDYSNVHTCGPTQLYKELTNAGFFKFAQRVARGEFDATSEESDEWARSAEGQEVAKHLTPEMRKLLGMNLTN